MQAASRSLFGTWADPLLLGGGSVLVLALLALLTPPASMLPAVGVATLMLANFVNHPHFAHSYQLFYGSWADNVRPGAEAASRWKWRAVGLYVPLLLALGLGAGAWAWLAGHRLGLALMLNLMGALVGWHYVKQGFGMAMTDAALKRRFWPGQVRRALLINAYACWAAAWALVNGSNFGRGLWGIVGVQFQVPDLLVGLACLVAAGTTAWVGVELARCLRQWRREQVPLSAQPLAGALAYVVTLYLWTVFAGINPFFALVIPFFHSLQYLTVVWRYKLNEAGQRSARPGHELLGFALRGLVLGALGFWLLPGAIDYASTGALPIVDQHALLALACFWIFINVHHYLIDNLLWRKENPRVNQFLFQPARRDSVA